MKNPFSSDRNIFSQISKPSLGKITQKGIEKKGEKGLDKGRQEYNSENPLSSVQMHNEPKAFKKETYKSEVPYYHSQEDANQAEGKVTFGKPPINNDKQFNLQLKNRTPLEKPAQANHDIYASNRMSFGTVDKFIHNDDGMEIRQTSGEGGFKPSVPSRNSRPIDHLQMSPITQRSRHQMSEDEFLNLDAINDDLGKILTSEKNKEQICRLLGIQAQSQRIGREKEQKLPPQELERKDDRRYTMGQEQKKLQRQIMKKQSIYSQKQGKCSKMERNDEKYQSYTDGGDRKSGRKQEKEQKLPVFGENYEVNFDESSYLPSLDNSSFTQSKQKSKKFTKQESFQEGQQQLSVFNYYQPQSQQQSSNKGMDLDQILKSEMSKLCEVGNQRTFISGSDKIVGIRYKLEYI